MTTRQTHPRINCLVPGCRRGTTTCAPNEDGTAPEIICGPHWRSAPKSWRTAMTFYRRRFTAAERKGDDRGMMVASRCWWSGWNRIVRLLCNPESTMDGDFPLGMAETLRREGLL